MHCDGKFRNYLFWQPRQEILSRGMSIMIEHASFFHGIYILLDDAWGKFVCLYCAICNKEEGKGCWAGEATEGKGLPGGRGLWRIQGPCQQHDYCTIYLLPSSYKVPKKTICCNLRQHGCLLLNRRHGLDVYGRPNVVLI